MLNGLLRAGNCCMNQGNVGSYTNANGDTAVWLNCGRLDCSDKSYCVSLLVVLEAENNMRNEVEAMVGAK